MGDVETLHTARFFGNMELFFQEFDDLAMVVRAD
jgi:hypothetical protein